MITSLQNWSNRRRAIKEARLLLREARRAQRKYAHRLSERAGQVVADAIGALTEACNTRDGDRIATGINALDRALDEHLPFARKSTFREYSESIAVAVLIALFLRAFVVEAFKIPSGSMIPTLQVGDHIFVNKFIYGVRVPGTNIKFGMDYRKPRRGEVIVFIYPKEPDKDFIKRIVAVEGDTIEMRDNQLYVNGQPVAREHVNEDCRYDDFEEMAGRWEEKRCEEFVETVPGNRYLTIFDKNGTPHSYQPQAPITVPPESVFVMGDNRDNSHDSRYWGFVPYDLIKGKAMVIWFSYGPEDSEDVVFLRWLKSIRGSRMFHLVR